MRDTEEVSRGVDDEEEACHPRLQRSSGPALVVFFHAEDSSTMPQVNCLRKASLKTEHCCVLWWWCSLLLGDG
ncbi:unnamed protein product [Ectocarpus sp. 8 AP-2014]